jgi:hypothetical protein
VRLAVLDRLVACRTAELGTHLCVCESCGWKAPVYNPCRNRHCPQCQGRATQDWVEARKVRMLPVPHFQVVFTLPAELRAIALGNPETTHALLFRTAAGVLQDLAAQRLFARLGITEVLHTWTSELSYHPHVHCLVTAGGLSLDDERWIDSREDYLFPGRILGAMFRGRFLEGLIDAVGVGEICLPGGDPIAAAKAFRSTMRALSKRHARWVVHVEPPKGRPAEYAVGYLGRYVKRIAISDARILAVTDSEVTFRTKTGPLTLDGAEFVRRFLLHVLPTGFRKVRHCGLYAPGNAKVRLEMARAILAERASADAAAEPAGPVTETPADKAPVRHSALCPACGKPALRHVFTDDGLEALARGPP